MTDSAETTNALTMKLLALASTVEGSRKNEIMEAIAALPGAFFAEREKEMVEIKRLKEENQLLKERLAQEVLVNSGRVPAPPPPPPPPLNSTPTAPKGALTSRQAAAEGRRLHISNLSHSITEHDVRKWFRGFTIEAVDLIPRAHQPDARGYGFVNVASAAEAQRAIQILNGRSLLDRRASVSLAKALDSHSSCISTPIDRNRTSSVTRPSHDPRRLTPPTSLDLAPPAKRQRTDSASSSSHRRPKCVGCFQIGAPCDGKSLCGACKGRNYGCEYNECWDLVACRDVKCTRLHPDQWDRGEEPRRKVKPWKP